jgi:hypothetical protein
MSVILLILLLSCYGNRTGKRQMCSNDSDGSLVFGHGRIKGQNRLVHNALKQNYADAALLFSPVVTKSRYSMSCFFISLRGTMASTRPWSRRNSAV